MMNRFRFRPDEPGGGQTHTVEIVIFVLIAVVLGLFVFTFAVPAIEDFWRHTISQIGTIK